MSTDLEYQLVFPNEITLIAHCPTIFIWAID